MSDLVIGMRIALDEVEHDDLNDIFTNDTDEEMKQAIETAAQQLLLTAPAQMLLPQRRRRCRLRDGRGVRLRNRGA